MSEKKELELLIDIAKLLKKYGPETFESLAKNLILPDFSERLASVLSRAAKIAESVPSKELKAVKKKTPKKDFRSSLVELDKTDPEKSGLLLSFYDNMIEKKFLPTLRNIHTFLSDMGFQPPKAKSREKAIVPLVKMLSTLSIDELIECLNDVKAVSRQDDRSLEGWSNIILDKQRGQKAK